MSKTFSLQTLGCRFNQADSERLRSILLGCGLEEKAPGEKVDFALVNTCTITAEADRKSRQMVRRAQGQAAAVVATGCGLAARGGFGPVSPAVLALDPARREELWLLMRERWPEALGNEIPSDIQAVFRQRHQRALLRVQEGCDHFCTYCIVPYVRGRSRSLPMAEVLQQAEALEKAGYREIVLTGIHLSMWGREWGKELDLADLMEALLERLQVARLRIGSIEPMSFPRRILDLMRRYPQRVCPHLHLALQHASNSVLARMRRDYTREQYEELAGEFEVAAPDGCLTTDILVGFPGESAEEFGELCHYLEHERAFYHLHVFPYSRRPGTVAWHMPNQLSTELKHKRVAVVNSINARRKAQVLRRFRGTTRTVIAETLCPSQEQTDLKAGQVWLKGTADNFISVIFPGTEDLLGKLVSVELNKIS